MAKVAKVTSKGQVTLPLSIRKKLGIRKGSRIVFLERGNEIRVVREEDLECVFDVFESRRRQLRLTRRRLGDLVKEAKGRLWKDRR